MAVAVEKLEPRFWPPSRTVEHLWQDPNVLSGYADVMYFEARRRNQFVGSWTLPVERHGDEIHARYSTRFLPYASPHLVDKHPRDRRETLLALMTAVMNHVSFVNLPFDHEFHDLGAFCQLGGFFEARHTHLVLRGYGDEYLSGPAGNHLRVAERKLVARIHTNTSEFEFERAIVDSSSARIAARRSFALALSGKTPTFVVDALQESAVVGQVFVMRSGSRAVFMHSWFDRETAVRGTPTFLVAIGVRQSLLNAAIKLIDLEGSVISRVDEFMDGLGAMTAIYPVLIWARDKDLVRRAVQDSLQIAGRERH